MAPVLAVAHEVTGALLESRRFRHSCEKKITALLNEDQKAMYRAYKSGDREDDRAREGRGRKEKD